MPKTGSCLCGAVKFTLNTPPAEAGACHCEMCRKWSGGVYLAITANADDVSFTSDDSLATYASSDWAERGFCKTCGSSLFYRVTAPGPHHGQYHFGLGTLDDPSGITLTSEIFIDAKPEAYAFEGISSQMTGAELFAMFSDQS